VKTSDNGLAFVAREEGTVLHVYLDSAGVPTIGVGHVVKAGESYPSGITHDQALALLRQDIHTAESAVNEHIKVTITQNQFDACVSFAFNAGGGAFAGSSLLTLINSGQSGDAEKVTLAFSVWSKRHDPKTGGLVTDQGLLNRRHREATLFLTADGAQPQVVPSPVPAPKPVPPPSNEASKVTVPSYPGEKPGDKIVGLVRFYVGCSLTNRREELGELVARGVDNPEAVIGISTNCGTTALGIMALAGAKHHLLSEKYQNGMAIAWLRQIGLELGALKKFVPGTQLKPGSLVRYNTAGKNDDHVEWVLTAPDANGTADHAGGGRDQNAISEGTGNVLTSLGRPLVEWWDPDMLAIDTVPAMPDAPPAPEPAPQPVPAPGPAPVVPATSSGWSAAWSFVKWLFKIFFKGR
jgi:lysozyme